METNWKLYRGRVHKGKSMKLRIGLRKGGKDCTTKDAEHDQKYTYKYSAMK